MVIPKDSWPASAEQRLKELDIQLPSAPAPFGTYVETVQSGNLLFLSGMLPVVDRKPKFIGRLGKELDTEAGRDAAYIAALNVLAAAKEHLGSLDRVTRVVRLGVFIAPSGDFFDHPRVADAVIANASPTLSSLTLATVWMRFGVIPAWESCAVSAMVKQPA
jgi:enamine deaminase RidA (YjgF/YER057c/UK114 family)